MLQVVQSLRSGRLTVATVPAPVSKPGHLLIANRHSILSPGTERAMLELARKSLLGKARERPDQVRRVLEKMRNEGILNTVSQVLEKLEEPVGPGYSSAGIVLECGPGVEGVRPGDRVASNGAHAGVVCVPKNLCALVAEAVPLDQAAYAVLGAVALQGLRLAHLSLGESAFVVGLGLVGQLTVALLKASGCRVFGTDPDAWKCDRALAMGAEAARPDLGAGEVQAATRGLGADAVLITASTKTDEPVGLAAEAVRPKGRIVAVGTVGLNLPRRPFYLKEAEFVVSKSYGPGRYDPEYEERGRDYPAAYVRWTEQRNLQAVLDLMAAGRLDLSPLTSHRFKIEEAEAAYRMIESGAEKFMGISLEYPAAAEPLRRRIERAPSMPSSGMGLGLLGAGNFARMVLLPAVQKSGFFHPRILCSGGGISTAHAGERFGFDLVTTDETEVFAEPKVQAVFIATRHDLHAGQILKGLRAGKHVFSEKPLALTLEEIDALQSCIDELGPSAPRLMVGFNRRFSPAARAVRKFFETVSEPLTVAIRFNAGTVPPEHWTQDEAVGGGRLIGEACHAIDLACSLTGSLPIRVFADSVGGRAAPAKTDDQCFITLRHANGSVSSVAYLAGGDKSYPKERVEVIGGGRVAVIDDFQQVTTVAHGKSKTDKRWSQDKGHRAEIEAFAQALSKGEPSPISWEEIRAISLASILAVRSLREGGPFEVL